MLKLVRLLLVLPFAALVLGWFLFLRPEALGGPATYVMVYGRSMEPTLWGGDLAVVRRQHDYSTGDIVAFRVQGGMVIHRIVGEEADGFVTQGDNRDSPDSWRPTADDTVGRVWFSIPGGARFVGLLRQPLPLGAVAGAVGMLTVLLGPGWRLRLSIPGRRRRRPEQGRGED